MRIAVTGASGRLGRSVVDVLRAAGHEVQAMDRESVDGAAGVEVDLRDPVATRAALTALHPEAVVHLAAIAVPFSAPEREIFTVNTSMAFDVIEAAVEAGASRVLVASSPTVLGYGAAEWTPSRLPLDETTPVAPAHAYALSKVCVEEMVSAFARAVPGVRFAAFRPCYVVPPEEWTGAPTQQGHTIIERLQDPALAAVSLFNYVDARDAGEFVAAWLLALDAPTGACYVVGAEDALATAPLSDLLPLFHPGTAGVADVLTGTRPAFDSSAATRDTGWVARRSWRTELSADDLATVTAARPASTLDQRILS
ncbi:NAD(P)-dependent oxidoreductase [Microbacterium sp. 1P10UB]|uniref:NAD-dependent epimerase/dehydratase family protein n=1 Tax=unclassified Microbacterium TaxID=2609290 RepID=UPI00399FE26B